jgi:hypothetical protein
MIDALAEAEGIRLTTTQHKALIGKGIFPSSHLIFSFSTLCHCSSFLRTPLSGEIGASQVLLAKPQTFMNLSGESVRI